MKEARKFSRDDPVTKVELFNALFDGHTFVECPVIDFKMQCGDNAIKYLMREGYAYTVSKNNVDYYGLTPIGEQWLREGLARFLVLHPDRAADVKRPTKRSETPSRPAIKRIVRRSR